MAYQIIFRFLNFSNSRLFGYKSNEVDEIWRNGYSSSKYYNENARLRRIIEALIIGFNGESFADIANYLLTGSPVADPYMCMADFADYSSTQQKISKKMNKKSFN